VALKATGLSESVPADGGFLVEQEFIPRLLTRVWETGLLVGRVDKQQVGPNFNGMKYPADAETSRADGSRAGGILMYWAAEAGTKTASTPAFRQISLELKKLIGLCYATDELLQDAVALETYIMKKFGEEMGFKLDDAILRGTGAGQPMGILNSPALVTVAKETNQAAATVVTENILKMRSRLWGKSRKNSVWLINQDVEPQLHALSLAVGTGGIPVYMPANGLSQEPYDTLFGRPVLPIEQCSTLGTVGDIVLVDLSQYLMIDKGQLAATSSIHVKFQYDETAFRFVYRVDGQPWWNSPLTPYKGTNTQSPFVALATRA
jgi:HK97 family phage major capsid protein